MKKTCPTELKEQFESTFTKRHYITANSFWVTGVRSDWPTFPQKFHCSSCRRSGVCQVAVTRGGVSTCLLTLTGTDWRRRRGTNPTRSACSNQP